MLGVMTLFLPFTWDTSPIEALEERLFWRLAAPFFLAGIIGALTLHLWLAGRLHGWERTTSLILALGVGVVTLSFYAADWSNFDRADWRAWAMLTPLVMLAAGAGMVGRMWRGRSLPDLTAIEALVLAYVPNSALCLVGFAGEWQAGGYVALLATAGYLVAAGQIWVTRGVVGRPARASG